MNRADQLIDLYNQIDSHLRQAVGVGNGESFSLVVDSASARYEVVRRNALRLKTFGDLRNVIIHHRHRSRQIIAEPTEEAVKEFEELVRSIVAPTPLYPTFRRELRCFSLDERLVTVLRYMGDNDFSQVITQKDKRLGLLTVEGIARWLEQQEQDDIISVKDALVEHALAYEHPDSFQLISRNGTINDAEEVFSQAIENGKPRLFALIITHSGELTEKPLGSHLPHVSLLY